MKKFKIVSKIVLACIIVALISSCDDSDNKSVKLSSAQSQAQPFSQMLIYPKKNPVVPFNLIAQDDSLFSHQDLKGHWTLLFMGFTQCPDICPNTMTEMARIYQALDENVRDKVRVTFLSVDPKRDSPSHLKEYLGFFDPSFIGITGEKSQIDALVYSLGGIYAIGEEDEQYYSVDHTARIFIINPQGERHGIFTGDALRAKDYALLVSELEAMINRS